MNGVGSNISLGTIGATAGIPNLNVATVPAAVRTGGSRAMQAYSEGLAFENVLVSELSQQLAKTMFGGSASDGSGADPAAAGTSADGAASRGMLGGAGAYASLIPQALTSSIMADGGLGMAETLARELDPALRAPAAAPAGATGPSARPVAL